MINLNKALFPNRKAKKVRHISNRILSKKQNKNYIKILDKNIRVMTWSNRSMKEPDKDLFLKIICRVLALKVRQKSWLPSILSKSSKMLELDNAWRWLRKWKNKDYIELEEEFVSILMSINLPKLDLQKKFEQASLRESQRKWTENNRY